VVDRDRTGDAADDGEPLEAEGSEQLLGLARSGSPFDPSRVGITLGQWPSWSFGRKRAQAIAQDVATEEQTTAPGAANDDRAIVASGVDGEDESAAEWNEVEQMPEFDAPGTEEPVVIPAAAAGTESEVTTTAAVNADEDAAHEDGSAEEILDADDAEEEWAIDLNFDEDGEIDVHSRSAVDGAAEIDSDAEIDGGAEGEDEDELPEPVLLHAVADDASDSVDDDAAKVEADDSASDDSDDSDDSDHEESVPELELVEPLAEPLRQPANGFGANHGSNLAFDLSVAVEPEIGVAPGDLNGSTSNDEADNETEVEDAAADAEQADAERDDVGRDDVERDGAEQDEADLAEDRDDEMDDTGSGATVHELNPPARSNVTALGFGRNEEVAMAEETEREEPESEEVVLEETVLEESELEDAELSETADNDIAVGVSADQITEAEIVDHDTDLDDDAPGGIADSDSSDADFANGDLTDADLAGVDFANGHLAGADFARSDLADADFTNGSGGGSLSEDEDVAEDGVADNDVAEDDLGEDEFADEIEEDEPALMVSSLSVVPVFSTPTVAADTADEDVAGDDEPEAADASESTDGPGLHLVSADGFGSGDDDPANEITAEAAAETDDIEVDADEIDTELAALETEAASDIEVAANTETETVADTVADTGTVADIEGADDSDTVAETVAGIDADAVADSDRDSVELEVVDEPGDGLDELMQETAALAPVEEAKPGLPSIEDLRAMAADLDDVDAILERLDNDEEALFADMAAGSATEQSLDFAPAE
jgi:uncharacterized protein YjbI with pentapeptide repeats